MKFNKQQHKFAANKLMDSANVILATLVVGQLVTDRVQPILLILGMLLYLGGWIMAMSLRKGVKR